MYLLGDDPEPTHTTETTDPDPTDPNESNDPKPTNPTEVNDANQGRCPRGDTKKGFTTYTFWLNDVQRCFTTYNPPGFENKSLPVRLTMQCYAKGNFHKKFAKKRQILLIIGILKYLL